MSDRNAFEKLPKPEIVLTTVKGEKGTEIELTMGQDYFLLIQRRLWALEEIRKIFSMTAGPVDYAGLLKLVME